jgi:hypothetical protein
MGWSAYAIVAGSELTVSPSPPQIVSGAQCTGRENRVAAQSSRHGVRGSTSALKDASEAIRGQQRGRLRAKSR